MLVLKGVTKNWPNGKPALANVSFTAPANGLIALIGPSGSGKSTLLRVISGLEEIDGGSIERPDGAIGMVFQEPSLWPHLTLLENVSRPLWVVAKLGQKEATCRATEALNAWGLGQRLDAYPADLSGGEQQRGSIARTLAMNPKVLCLDEITSALDPERTAEILDRLRELKRCDVTMIMSTHQLGFAREAADAVLFMDGGAILESGSPKELLDRPQNVRVARFVSAAFGTTRQDVGVDCGLSVAGATSGAGATQ